MDLGNESFNLINSILVDLFNDILTIEQKSLQGGTFNDLSITEVHTIDAIGKYEPRTMSQVAADLGITVGTLTTAVNKLIKKGYVERKRGEEDRRVVLIQLTKKGKIVYKMHERFHRNMVKETIEGLSPEEERTLIEALKKLKDFFENKCLK